MDRVFHQQCRRQIEMGPAFAQQLSKIADVHGRGHKKISSRTRTKTGEKDKRRIVPQSPRAAKGAKSQLSSGAARPRRNPFVIRYMQLGAKRKGTLEGMKREPKPVLSMR